MYENEAKDAVIRQQGLIIKDQLHTIAAQRNHISRLEYNNHRFDVADKEPLRFLLWVLLRDVWPFKYLWVR